MRCQNIFVKRRWTEDGRLRLDGRPLDLTEDGELNVVKLGNMVWLEFCSRRNALLVRRKEHIERDAQPN